MEEALRRRSTGYCKAQRGVRSPFGEIRKPIGHAHMSSARATPSRMTVDPRAIRYTQKSPHLGWHAIPIVGSRAMWPPARSSLPACLLGWAGYFRKVTCHEYGVTLDDGRVVFRWGTQRHAQNSLAMGRHARPAGTLRCINLDLKNGDHLRVARGSVSTALTLKTLVRSQIGGGGDLKSGPVRRAPTSTCSLYASIREHMVETSDDDVQRCCC